MGEGDTCTVIPAQAGIQPCFAVGTCGGGDTSIVRHFVIPAPAFAGTGFAEIQSHSPDA
jgi:hypothetical protein